MNPYQDRGPGHPSQYAQFLQSTGVDDTTVTGTASATQQDDTPAATGTETISGTAAPTQADQTSAATGTETVTGTVAASQDDQTSSATGTAAGDTPVNGGAANRPLLIEPLRRPPPERPVKPRLITGHADCWQASNKCEAFGHVENDPEVAELIYAGVL